MSLSCTCRFPGFQARRRARVAADGCVAPRRGGSRVRRTQVGRAVAGTFSDQGESAEGCRTHVVLGRSPGRGWRGGLLAVLKVKVIVVLVGGGVGCVGVGVIIRGHSINRPNLWCEP